MRGAQLQHKETLDELMWPWWEEGWDSSSGPDKGISQAEQDDGFVV